MSRAGSSSRNAAVVALVILGCARKALHIVQSKYHLYSFIDDPAFLGDIDLVYDMSDSQPAIYSILWACA